MDIYPIEGYGTGLLMTAGQVLIRGYEPGDEDGIRRLFSEVFGHDRTIGQWSWQYNDPGQGKGWISIGEMDNSILAHHGIARADLSHKGRRIVAGQAGDSMVHAKARGNKLFPKLLENCYGAAIADGLQATYGFPNRQSYPGAVKYLDKCKIIRLRYFFRRIGYRKVLGSPLDGLAKWCTGLGDKVIVKARKVRYRNDVRITTTATVPDDLEEMLAAKRTYDIFAVWKDPRYLAWRYERHPHHTYFFHTARTRGTPRALLITRQFSDVLAVCDLLHGDYSEEPALELLFHIAGQYRHTGVQRMDFYGHDSGFFEYLFGLAGFTSIPFSPLVFMGKPFDPGLYMDFYSDSSWTIVYGDTDII